MDNVISLGNYTLSMTRKPRITKPERSEPVTETLRGLRERAGLSMAEMAKLLGYKGASSYQRYEDPETYNEGYLPARFVRRLIQVLPGRGSPPITANEITILLGDSIHLLEPPRNPLAPPESERIPLIGEVQAGVWREASENQEDPSVFPHIAINPIRGVPSGLQFAVTIRGESMNRVANDGDIAICASTKDGHIYAMANDVVLVQRFRDDESIYELTLKRYATEFDGTRILIPESTDPRYQDPIELDEPGSVDVTVQVAAVVLAIVRFPSNPRHLEICELD